MTKNEVRQETFFLLQGQLRKACSEMVTLNLSPAHTIKPGGILDRAIKILEPAYGRNARREAERLLKKLAIYEVARGTD